MPQTTVESELIERIVQEVIRRLLGRGVEITPSPAHDNCLSIEDRVVTLATLDGRLQGVNRLRIRSNAVVTPAVKDRLREMKVELIRGQ